MNKNLQDSTAHTSARRRLVRGVFAAPAALTLYSGSAFAVASMSCVAKEVNNPTYPTAVPSVMPSDTYLRVQLHTLEASTPSAWIKGSDITALQITGTPFPYMTGSQWQCFVAGSETVTIDSQTFLPVPGMVYDNQPTRSSGTITPQPNGSYVAIRIDASGKIVGVVQDGGDTDKTSAVHQSCWTSFKPTP